MVVAAGRRTGGSGSPSATSVPASTNPCCPASSSRSSPPTTPRDRASASRSRTSWPSACAAALGRDVARPHAVHPGAPRVSRPGHPGRSRVSRGPRRTSRRSGVLAGCGGDDSGDAAATAGASPHRASARRPAEVVTPGRSTLRPARRSTTAGRPAWSPSPRPARRLAPPAAASARASSSPRTARSRPTPTWSPAAEGEHREGRRRLREVRRRQPGGRAHRRLRPVRRRRAAQDRSRWPQAAPAAARPRRRRPVGEPVVAIGSPFGEEQSLSVGVISGIGRPIESLTASTPRARSRPTRRSTAATPAARSSTPTARSWGSTRRSSPPAAAAAASASRSRSTPSGARSARSARTAASRYALLGVATTRLPAAGRPVRACPSTTAPGSRTSPGRPCRQGRPARRRPRAASSRARSRRAADIIVSSATGGPARHRRRARPSCATHPGDRVRWRSTAASRKRTVEVP